LSSREIGTADPLAISAQLDADRLERKVNLDLNQFHLMHRSAAGEKFDLISPQIAAAPVGFTTAATQLAAVEAHRKDSETTAGSEEQARLAAERVRQEDSASASASPPTPSKDETPSERNHRLAQARLTEAKAKAASSSASPPPSSSSSSSKPDPHAVLQRLAMIQSTKGSTPQPMAANAPAVLTVPVASSPTSANSAVTVGTPTSQDHVHASSSAAASSTGDLSSSTASLTLAPSPSSPRGGGAGRNDPASPSLEAAKAHEDLARADRAGEEQMVEHHELQEEHL
jgi:hypothetical protein